VADLAQESFFDDPLPGLDQVGRALPLGADLDHPAQPPGRRQDRLPLEHVHADRLLQVDVGAGLHRRDGVERVPVVGRAHEHDVELVSGEHLPVVAVGAGRRCRGRLPLLRDRDRFREVVAIGIGDRHDLDRRDLHEPPEVALAVPARPDQPHPPRLGDGGQPRLPEERRGEAARGRGEQAAAADRERRDSRPGRRRRGRARTSNLLSHSINIGPLRRDAQGLARRIGPKDNTGDQDAPVPGLHRRRPYPTQPRIPRPITAATPDVAGSGTATNCTLS
jgi:hypothetical protein